MNEWMNKIVNEWMNEWNSEWMNEIENEWNEIENERNEWMNEWINEWAKILEREGFLLQESLTPSKFRWNTVIQFIATTSLACSRQHSHKGRNFKFLFVCHHTLSFLNE